MCAAVSEVQGVKHDVLHSRQHGQVAQLRSRFDERKDRPPGLIRGADLLLDVVRAGPVLREQYQHGIGSINLGSDLCCEQGAWAGVLLSEVRDDAERTYLRGYPPRDLGVRVAVTDEEPSTAEIPAGRS